MQGLNADEERQVLGEILAYKLKVIEEYLEPVLVDIPVIKARVINIDERLTAFERMVNAHDKELSQHDKDIKYLKTRIA